MEERPVSLSVPFLFSLCCLFLSRRSCPLTVLTSVLVSVLFLSRRSCPYLCSYVFSLFSVSLLIVSGFLRENHRWIRQKNWSRLIFSVPEDHSFSPTE